MGELRSQRLETFDEVVFAVADVALWGFPRFTTRTERDQGLWYRLGDSVVFWFEAYPSCSTHFVHLAVAPEARKRWPVRRWLREIDRLALENGAQAIGFVPAPGCEEAEGYLRRLGWQDAEHWLEKSLTVGNSVEAA